MGLIKGKGTGTSDSIKAMLKEGDFIIPTTNSKKKVVIALINELGLNKKDGLKSGGVPVMVSNGEIRIPKNLVPKADKILKGKGVKGGLNDLKLQRLEDGGVISTEKPEDYSPEKYKKILTISEGGNRTYAYVVKSSKNSGKFYNISTIKDEDGSDIELWDSKIKTPSKKTSTGILNEEPVQNQEIQEQSQDAAISQGISTGVTPGSSEGSFLSEEELGLKNTDTEITDLKGKSVGLDTNSNFMDNYNRDEKGNVTLKKETTPLVDNKGGGDTPKDKWGMTDYLGLGQTAVGAAGLIAQGKRKDFEIPQTIRNMFSDAQERAKYGFDPQVRNLYLRNIENQKNMALRNAVDQSAGVTYGNQLAVLRSTQDALGNAAVAEQAEKSRKVGQMYELGSRVGQYEAMKEQDRLNRFDKTEEAYAGTMNTGIANIIGSQKYREYLRALKDARSNSQVELP